MYKQIIIARKDLMMSPGKLAAQVSHASMAFLIAMIRSEAVKQIEHRYWAWDDPEGTIPARYKHRDLDRWAETARQRGDTYFYARPVDPANPYGELEPCDYNYHFECSFVLDKELFDEWINGAYTKCVLQAKNKTKLLQAIEYAESCGMKEGVDFFLIRDNCYTELEPEEPDGRTITCIGFRPMKAEQIDQIGKRFHLYT